MKQLVAVLIVVTMAMEYTGSQYPDCVNCTNSLFPLSPLSYNTIMRSHVFNGTQPSNEGCTNGVSIDGQVTIDCGQGTTLIDCDQGYNDNADYSDLSNYFIWSRFASVGLPVSIMFRFDQGVRGSRISMFFWNSQINSIIVPNVMVDWGDHNMLFRGLTTITTNSPNRTEDGQRILNIDINNAELQFQYLRIVMSFCDNSEWIFLSEVQFCGNTAPYHITQPSTDNDVQIVSPTATMATLTCSLNVTIPSSAIVTWTHNNTYFIPFDQSSTAGSTTTLTIENLQSSDAGLYQCTFNDAVGSGWILRRNIRLLITNITTTSRMISATTAIITTVMVAPTVATAIIGITTNSGTIMISTVVAVTSTNITTTATASDFTGFANNIITIIASIIAVTIAIVVAVLIIVCFWRKRKKAYHVYDNPHCSDANTHSMSAKAKGNSYETSTIQNIDYIQRPPAAYAIPNEKGKDVEQQKRMSMEVNYKPHCSLERSVQSQKQTLSMINSDNDQTIEFVIYETVPECTKASHCMVYDDAKEENPIYNLQENPLYSEAIAPTITVTSSSHEYSSINDDQCPYASIPLPLTKSEGPPIVSSKNIESLDQLGTGQFGEVILANTVGLSKQYLGIGNSNDSTISMKVAVKTLKSSPSEDVQKAFEKEIKFMSRLKDDNVIRLLGICTIGTPFIMMEYMENGNLNGYLQQFQFTTDKLPTPKEITLNALVYMSYQIASGMNYLSSCNFIHRDLAARNVLVGVDYTIKIADFGMSQNLYSAYYCKVSGQNVLPIRWMAYECFYGKFSMKTDVWAFGITLWEIFTLCRCMPFEDLTDQQVVDDALKGANRRVPEQPENCPNAMYKIMKGCWQHDPLERATFRVLCDLVNDYYITTIL